MPSRRCAARCISTAAWRPCARCIGPLFEARIAALPEPSTLKDAKTRLQEYLQANGRPLPLYTVKRTSGEPHAQIFLVSCAVPHAVARDRGRGPEPAARRTGRGAGGAGRIGSTCLTLR